MADRLSEEFGVTIATLTPYDWWKRSKSETILVPLPTPIRWVGRSPVFLWRDVRRWYLAYKETTLDGEGRVREPVK